MLKWKVSNFVPVKKHLSNKQFQEKKKGAKLVPRGMQQLVVPYLPLKRYIVVPEYPSGTMDLFRGK